MLELREGLQRTKEGLGTCRLGHAQLCGTWLEVPKVDVKVLKLDMLPNMDGQKLQPTRKTWRMLLSP